MLLIGMVRGVFGLRITVQILIYAAPSIQGYAGEGKDKPSRSPIPVAYVYVLVYVYMSTEIC